MQADAPRGFTSIPFFTFRNCIDPKYRNAEYPAILQTGWALEGALMSRERWMILVLAGLSVILGILLFFFD